MKFFNSRLIEVGMTIMLSGVIEQILTLFLFLIY